ncbi:fimbrial protein [Serratia marcescens]|uniref:fimbrial protein n=1 Tax=Serratia marcescens TaxID=615 RepID=UPI002404FCF1|nr:fimbrial protein [Serratia marcescens]MDF9719697.1 fimbrial protein [Serratia marcescens]
MNGTIRYQKAACLLCGLLAMLPRLAAGVDIASITVKVTVVMPPPCVINDNRVIAVEFGDVMTTRVDGENYRKPIVYTLDCKGAPSNAVKLQVQGNSTSFDGTVLRSDKVGLGIKLLQGDNKLPINTWLNFTYPNQPELWAVPVKQNGMALTGGEFTASATMKVDYQ